MCAYNANGDWYFDPNIDAEDNELVQDEFKRARARDFVDTQRKITRQQTEANDIMADVLKEEGIDHETYLALVNEDEATTKAAYRESVRHLVKSVKKGRGRDYGGRFTKAPAGDRASSHHRPANPERLSELKQVSNTRALTDSEQEEAVDAMIGRLF